MKIEGTNMFNYDAQHLQIVKRETPQSIKPNIFMDIDEQVATALLMSDVVSLSAEAKELLKKLRRQMNGKTSLAEAASDKESIKELIYTLRQLRETVYGEE